MMRLSRFGGTPNIGVYAAANEEVSVIAANTTPDFVRDIETVLGVETVLTSVSGSYIIGSLVTMNSNGAVVTGMIESSELEKIRTKINVLVLPDKMNAAGNNILANDKGAIINPELGKKAEKEIGDILGVDTIRSSIGEYNTIGSVCVANNKGCLCCTDATDDDILLISDILKVEVKRGSVNHGSKHVGAGIICNSKGALIGDDTTPIEMSKIEDGLVLY